jgi:hypothetical protein
MGALRSQLKKHGKFHLPCFFGLYVLCAPTLSTFVLIFWSQFEDLETFKGEVA